MSTTVVSTTVVCAVIGVALTVALYGVYLLIAWVQAERTVDRVLGETRDAWWLDRQGGPADPDPGGAA